MYWASARFTQCFVWLQGAEAAAKEAEQKAAKEEVDRQKRIKDSYDAVVPDEIQQRVQAALQKEMVSVRPSCIQCIQVSTECTHSQL